MKSFRVNFILRNGGVVPFGPLTKEECARIVGDAGLCIGLYEGWMRGQGEPDKKPCFKFFDSEDSTRIIGFVLPEDIAAVYITDEKRVMDLMRSQDEASELHMKILRKQARDLEDGDAWRSNGEDWSSI